MVQSLLVVVLAVVKERFRIYGMGGGGLYFSASKIKPNLPLSEAKKIQPPLPEAKKSRPPSIIFQLKTKMS